MNADHSAAVATSWFTEGWLFFGVYWLFLACLAGVETLRPTFKNVDTTDARLRVNFVLALVSLIATASVPLTVIAAAAWAQENGTGLFYMMDIGAIEAIVLAVLAQSFLTYWLHRAFHEVRWLWPIHAVHHSDNAIDLTTSFRAHPISTLLTLGVHVAFVLLLGLSPVGLILYHMAYSLSSPWHHANVTTSPTFERLASKMFVTPGFHRVHHSASEPQTNSNYSEFFTLWDWVFGTATPPHTVKQDALRIGLGDAYDVGSNSLRAQLTLPFRATPPPMPVVPSEARE